MFQRRVSVLTILAFLFSLFPMFTMNTFAYQNSGYFNRLRVGLSSMSSTSLNLTLNGSYLVNGQEYPSGAVLKLAMSGTSLTLDGVQQSQVEVIPTLTDNLLSVTAGTVTNKYMGSFVFKIYNGKILPINMIDMENYLKGVVGYEMSDYFPIEALKSQAVAARNYALTKLGSESAKGYDFDDTTLYQVYKGYNPNYANVINAVDQTKGQVLLYNDRVVEALYSAAHGGVSENSENVWGNYVPYLRSVVDSFESNPWPNGNVALSNASIKSTLTTKGYLQATDNFIKLDLTSIAKYPSGRVSNINIIYSDATGIVKSKAVTKDATRTFLSLPSNLYSVVYDSTTGVYTFSGKGNGHGLGMSQIGAKNRAAAGQTYATIMSFYYQNTYLENLIKKAVLGDLTQSTTALLKGGTISFNTTASAGNGQGYLFKYVIKNGDTVIAETKYSSNPAFSWTPDQSGDLTVQAYVKDLYSISEFDDTKASGFKVYDDSMIKSFNLSKTEAMVGEEVSAGIDIQGGSGTFQYKYEVSRNGEAVAVREYSADKQFTYNPPTPGSYAITVYVKDMLSSGEFNLKQTQGFEIYDSLAITSLSMDKESPFVGDELGFFTTVAAGSGKGTSYKYVLMKADNVIASTDYTNNSNWTFTPDESGRFTVMVYIKDTLSMKEYDDVKQLAFDVLKPAHLESLNIDKPQYLVGQNMLANANAIEGSGAYLYKFSLEKDGNIIAVQEYSTKSTFAYMMSEAGTYSITSYMKDQLSTKEFDDNRIISVQVNNQPMMAMTGSSEAVMAGTTAEYHINSAGGSGSYLYKFVVKKDGDSAVIVDSGYTTVADFGFTPTSSGIYQVTGYMRDSISENDVQELLSLNVYQPQLETVTVNGSFFEGKSLSFHVTSGGASPKGLAYRYEVISGGVIKASSVYNAASTFVYTPNTAGTYVVKIYGKDGLSNNSYDCIKEFNIDIAVKPLLLSKLPLSQGMSGNDVTLLQNALVKLGYDIGKDNGYFGKSTKSAVISFQKSKGLSADGIVGNITYGALNDALIQKSGTKTITF